MKSDFIVAGVVVVATVVVTVVVSALVSAVVSDVETVVDSAFFCFFLLHPAKLNTIAIYMTIADTFVNLFLIMSILYILFQCYYTT